MYVKPTWLLRYIIAFVNILFDSCHINLEIIHVVGEAHKTNLRTLFNFFNARTVDEKFSIFVQIWIAYTITIHLDFVED